jgi:membrane protease YdiL (CAAX protease family)
MSSAVRKARCDALVALLVVLLPNLVLSAVGLLMRGEVQQVTESRATGHFSLARFLRQAGLSAFLLLPAIVWLWRRRVGWTALGWRRMGLGPAAGLGALLGAATLLLRARPFDPGRLRLDDTWWALATYSVVAGAEETLYRGLLQRALSGWPGRSSGYLATALVFTALHMPQLLLGGEPLARTLVYAAGQLLPMGLLFGAVMVAARHVAAPILVHLAWNWASMLRSV